ncbi:MAG: hypothetical protein SVV80_02215 [Planctomycetota bacterium]|nr:hypothetical protein [Planctomycetota bacterium]
MAKKIYYTEQETLEKLGLTGQQLQGLVSEGKLRTFPDGQKKMFKAEEVDALVSAGEGVEVELTPADTAAEDIVTLSEAEEITSAPDKADTVITSEGISVFDEEDLGVDSMGKTAIAPSVEDRISLEGVGSGSGLLDLTRESDDTSLGAEVLEHIDVENAIPSSGVFEGITEAEETTAEAEPAVAGIPDVAEKIDAGSGAFSGLIVAGCLLMMLMGAVVIAVMLGTVPPYMESLQKNWLIFIGVSVVATAVLAIIGYVLGKSVAEKAAALQRTG